MNLQQLRTFVATARTGHLTKAAERLFLSQPAASAQLKALEQELELSLFTRLPSGLELTAAGRHLLSRAEALLLDADAILAEARRLTGNVSGKLRIGAATDPDEIRIGTILERLSVTHPLLETSVQQRKSISCYEGLAAGELDACFALRLHVDNSLMLTDLGEVTYVVAASPRLARQLQPWTLEASTQAPWVLPPSGSAHEQMLKTLFAQQGSLNLKPAAMLDNEYMIRHCVMHGVGLGLWHEPAARIAEHQGLIRVAWDQRVTTKLVYAHVTERGNDPVIAALSDVVHSVWPVSSR